MDDLGFRRVLFAAPLRPPVGGVAVGFVFAVGLSSGTGVDAVAGLVSGAGVPDLLPGVLLP